MIFQGHSIKHLTIFIIMIISIIIFLFLVDRLTCGSDDICRCRTSRVKLVGGSCLYCQKRRKKYPLYKEVLDDLTTRTTDAHASFNRRYDESKLHLMSFLVHHHTNTAFTVFSCCDPGLVYTTITVQRYTPLNRPSPSSSSSSFHPFLSTPDRVTNSPATMNTHSATESLLWPVLLTSVGYVLSLLYVHFRSPLSTDELIRLRRFSQFNLLPLVYWSAWSTLTVAIIFNVTWSLLVIGSLQSFVAISCLLLIVLQQFDSPVCWLHTGSLHPGHVIERAFIPIRLWIDLQLLNHSPAHVPFALIAHLLFTLLRSVTFVLQSIRQSPHQRSNHQSKPLVATTTTLSLTRLVVHALLFLQALYSLQTDLTGSNTIWLNQLLVLVGLVLFMSAWADFQQRIDDTFVMQFDSKPVDCNNNSISGPNPWPKSSYGSKTPIGVYAVPQPVCRNVNRRFG